MQTVVHVSASDPADHRHALVNTRNLLDDERVSSPGDAVAIVGNGDGVRLFIEGVAAHPDLLAELAGRGVELLACRNSLRHRGVSDDDLLPGVSGVPSGVGALARLQDAGYGYIKAP